MANPWKGIILAFNRKRQEEGEKAGDLEALIQALFSLPPGQLKKVINDDVMAVLKKYGYEE